MSMLAALLHEQDRQEAWQAYTAQMLWYLNHAQYARMGRKFEHPTWLDMVRPEQKDERSGQEIVEEVKRKLREQIEKRKKKGGK